MISSGKGEELRTPSPPMEVSALELLEPSEKQRAEQLKWPRRVREAGPRRMGGQPGIPLALSELSPVRRYLETKGQAVYKIIIMERPEGTDPIQVSALWEYESQEQAERVRWEMTAAGLPANVQRRLWGLVPATERLCGTAEWGCAATTKRVQAALNEIWEWDPPGLWGIAGAASR